ncbi:MAG: hypothetical protein AAGC45_12995 [Bacteroidota bacterium]
MKEFGFLKFLIVVLFVSCGSVEDSNNEVFDPDNARFVGTWREYDNGEFFQPSRVLSTFKECDGNRKIEFFLNGEFEWFCYEGSNLNDCSNCGTFLGKYEKQPQGDISSEKYLFKYYNPDGELERSEMTFTSFGEDFINLTILNKKIETGEPFEEGEPYSTFTRYRKE